MPKRKRKLNLERPSLPVKLFAILVITVFCWTGLSLIERTNSYFSDIEESANNFTAGILDFELSSNQVFSGAILSPGESATGTISVINLENTPKYKLKADNFSGGLCDYLNLEANLDGNEVEYSGKLTEIDFGPVVFESPDDWFFTLTLPADAPEEIIGETCNFNFVFYGSQIKNDLPFGTGFTDTEDADSNLKAKMCFDSETRSKGYWQTHFNIAKPYLPQMLGNEIVGSTSSVYKVLKTDYSLSMRNKLKGQLLAMKFNVAHFGVGDYIPTSTASSVSQIITDADNLLKETPAPPDSVLEEMKNLLESLAQDLQIRVCTDTGVKVIIPNGGEQWWVGKYYDLTWITKNLGCPNGLSYIGISYSADSGNTWGSVTINTENDGIYNWRIPLFLEGNSYFVPSDKARIKVVAFCSENMMVAGWDISDYDFCPPIDPSLLTPEEIELAIALGLIEPPSFEENTTTETATDTATTTEDTGLTYNIGFSSPPPVIPENPTNNETPSTTDTTTTDNVGSSGGVVVPPPNPVVPSTPAPICGDNNIDDNEECDTGAQNGIECLPEYSLSCNYCSTECKNITLQGSYCGDEIKNGDEECDGADGMLEHNICDSSCALQYIPYCGDGNIDGGEECDNGTQNGIECIFEPGLSCTYCSMECKNVILQDFTASSEQ